jgi:hypothetical protein
MKLKRVLAAASLLVSPLLAPANAQQAGVYASGGYAFFDGDGGAELGAIMARVGANLSPNFAIEAEAAIGVKDDSGTELDSELGLFVLAKAPISPSFDVFARLGLGRIETSPGGTEDGLAYGVGGTLNLSPVDGVRLDYTRHDYDAGEVDVFALSYVRGF